MMDDTMTIRVPLPPPDDSMRISPTTAGRDELLRALDGLRAIAVGKRLIWHRLQGKPRPARPSFGASGWLEPEDRRAYHILACEARSRGLR